MTATNIKCSFRQLDLNERIKLLGELWDEVSAEPTLLDLSEEERKELENRYAKHHASPDTSRSWAEVLAGLRGSIPLTPTPHGPECLQRLTDCDENL